MVEELTTRKCGRHCSWEGRRLNVPWNIHFFFIYGASVFDPINAINPIINAHYYFPIINDCGASTFHDSGFHVYLFENQYFNIK